MPKFCAHQPVRDCDWSRPVKNASFSGAVSRKGFSHDTAVDSATSQLISSKAPDPRVYTRSLRGKAFVLSGYLADVRVEDWDRVPDNPYDVDRRYTYWLISDHYAHVGILFHCAFPLSRFPGVATPAPGGKVRVRAFGLFVRNFTYAPKGGSPIATPAFHLLHLEADGR